MAFTKLKLTTFGQTIEAKRHQGKGIKFTRVAIGDGLLGNGSMINRTELVSERHSMKIDGILTTDDGKQSVVVVTLDNSQFDEGFSYRELGLLAQDPDTQEEGVYLYDNAGAECEYLDTKDNGVVIYERLKLQIRVEQTENISFEASGNPLYLSAEDVEAMIQQHNTAEDAHPNKADLGEDGKVPSEQLPHMDYIPTTEKGKPGGVATLGPDGKVPAGQLPKMDYDPSGSAAAVQKNLTAHTGNKNNPHAVTAEQGGALASSGGVMSGAISMSGHKIANLAAPADSTDAANKQYVDEHAGAKVILGSYVGTGKSGKSNPNQITLAAPFKILCIYGMQSNNYYKSIDGYGNGETSNIIHSSIIPTEYTKGISFGFGYRYSSRDSYGKKSTDGKTFSWYFDLTTPDATSEQLNASGTVYYYYAIV